MKKFFGVTVTLIITLYLLIEFIGDRLIKNVFKNSGIKISKIGKIYNNKKKSQIINEKNIEIRLKNKGYFHKF